jgi:hypothetical protein
MKKPFVEYVHRSCLACQKRIPRWTDGKPTPKSKLFCDSTCSAYYRRMHPSKTPFRGNVKGATENPKKRPDLSALLEPVSVVEGRAEWRECDACGRQSEYRPGQPTFCSERCRAYMPPSSRKMDGEWFIVAGPIDYCSACHMAITARKPHGYLMPYRLDGQLRCGACDSVKAARKRTEAQTAGSV